MIDKLDDHNLVQLLQKGNSLRYFESLRNDTEKLISEFFLRNFQKTHEIMHAK